jgi:hypothetical protein
MFENKTYCQSRDTKIYFEEYAAAELAEKFNNNKYIYSMKKNTLCYLFITFQ